MDVIFKKIKSVKDKKALARTLEGKTDTNFNSIYNHWLIGGSIPERYRDIVLKETQKVLKIQNIKLNQIIEL